MNFYLINRYDLEHRFKLADQRADQPTSNGETVPETPKVQFIQLQKKKRGTTMAPCWTCAAEATWKRMEPKRHPLGMGPKHNISFYCDQHATALMKSPYER